MLNKGDVVVINDGSWSRTTKDNKLSYGPGGDRYTGIKNSNRKQYVIIETGCSFPNTGSSIGTFNNTVIQAVDFGKVVFIEERFLELVSPTHKVMIDIAQCGCVTTLGDIIEISDKLYKEIKRDSQS